MYELNLTNYIFNILLSGYDFQIIKSGWEITRTCCQTGERSVNLHGWAIKKQTPEEVSCPLPFFQNSARGVVWSAGGWECIRLTQVPHHVADKISETSFLNSYLCRVLFYTYSWIKNIAFKKPSIVRSWQYGEELGVTLMHAQPPNTPHSSLAYRPY